MAIGQAVPNIAPEPFYKWFMYIDESGATIGLVLLLFLIKSKYTRTLAKTAFVPAVFNINEPLILGRPIALNLILLIPFLITPMVTAIIVWFPIKWELVNRIVALAPLTLPRAIGAFLATGNDWRTAVLNILLIIVATTIYYSFVMIYDRQLLEEEMNEG